MERCRDRQRGYRPRHDVMVAYFGDDAALHDGLGQLLDEQWHAVCVINDQVDNLLGQRLAAGHARDYLGALPTSQAS